MKVVTWSPCARRFARIGLAHRLFSAGPDASKLSITRNSSPKELQPKETLKFGKTFTDHMFSVDHSMEKGWGTPQIIPYGDLSISPAASSLHYALQCFEGMKAYVDKDGNVRLFRPDMNMARLNTSAKRLLLPEFDGAAVIKCLEELLRIDKRWIPQGKGYSLYIRPTLISTHPFVGVAKAEAAKLFIILSPVGPYYPTGFAPVKLLADKSMVRAWPGGTGDVKCGGNYAMGINAGTTAAKKGYAQMLWLFGDDLQVTEVGTMNQFWLWINEDGDKELITASLDGTILPGITRDSILKLASDMDGLKVTERHYTLPEIMKAAEEGRLIEAFGSGTAAIVSPVNGFHFDGKEYEVPCGASGQAGDLTMHMAETLMGIQYGEIPHEWSVVVPNSKDI